MRKTVTNLLHNVPGTSYKGVYAQGRDMFLGTEMVARNLTTDNLHVARGKQVVVIGSAKSAVDAAGAAAEVADSVVMLSRKVSIAWVTRGLLHIPGVTGSRVHDSIISVT